MNYGYFEDNSKINAIYANLYPNLGQNVQNQIPAIQLDNRNMRQNFISPKKKPVNRPNNVFIEAKIGKNLVISQDLMTFLNGMKTTEWTSNNSYLIAKDIEVKPTFGYKTKTNPENAQKYSNKVDQLYLNVMDINQNDYLNYVNEVNNRKQKISENVKNERKEFLEKHFPNEGSNVPMNKILSKIREDYRPFISRDQILYNKIMNC